MINYYKIKGHRTLAELELRLRLHLLPFFGPYRMAQIDTALVQRYIVHRQAEQRVVLARRERSSTVTATERRTSARNSRLCSVRRPTRRSTVNSNISARCSRSRRRRGGSCMCPTSRCSTRAGTSGKGFSNQRNLRTCSRICPLSACGALHVSDRLAHGVGSARARRRSGRLRCRRSPSRSRHHEESGRTSVPIAEGDDLHSLLLERHKATKALQKKLGKMIPLVFYRVVEGSQGARVEPIKSFYKAWHAACRRAGLPGRIPHDMRRSSARNMVTKRTVPEKVAQELMGHKTAVIFARYNIVSPADLRDGAARLTGLLEADVKPRVKLRAIAGSRARRNR